MIPKHSNGDQTQQQSQDQSTFYRKKNYLPRKKHTWEERKQLEVMYPSRIDLSEPVFDVSVNFRQPYDNYR